MAKESEGNYYRILRGRASVIQRKADRLMADGWTPFGQLFRTGQMIPTTEYGREPELAQAMIHLRPKRRK